MELTYIRVTGLVALCFSLYAMSVREERALLIYMTIGSFVWGLNNYLLGAHTPCALSILSGFRTLTAVLSRAKSRRQQMPMYAVFSGLSLAAGVATWAGPISLLPMAGSQLSSFSTFFLKNTGLRIALVFSNLLWMGSAIYYSAWEQVFSLSAVLIATGVGLWRMRKVSLPPTLAPPHLSP